jgi:hypothetical protein
MGGTRGQLLQTHVFKRTQDRRMLVVCLLVSASPDPPSRKTSAAPSIPVSEPSRGRKSHAGRCSTFKLTDMSHRQLSRSLAPRQPPTASREGLWHLQSTTLSFSYSTAKDHLFRPGAIYLDVPCQVYQRSCLNCSGREVIARPKLVLRPLAHYPDPPVEAQCT